MNHYFIRIVRHLEGEKARKYPNLAKSPFYPTVATMSTQIDLEELKDSKVKKILKRKLEKDGMDVKDKYDISKKEKLNVVTQTKHDEKDSTDPVFEGKVKIPEEYRTDSSSKKGASEKSVRA